MTNTRRAYRMAWIAAAAAVFLAPAVRAAEFSENIVIASNVASDVLQDAVDLAGEQGMLIVDRPYLNQQSLELPRRFRMIGMGFQGQAVVAFNEVTGGSAITIGPGAGAGKGWVEIENLDIEGPFDHNNNIETSAKGIDLTNVHTVFLRNLTVRGFDVGIFGQTSFGVHVENCSVAVNRTDNYQLTRESHGWRIVGGLAARLGASASRSTPPRTTR